MWAQLHLFHKKFSKDSIAHDKFKQLFNIFTSYILMCCTLIYYSENSILQSHLLYPYQYHIQFFHIAMHITYNTQYSKWQCLQIQQNLHCLPYMLACLPIASQKKYLRLQHWEEAINISMCWIISLTYHAPSHCWGTQLDWLSPS